MPSHQAIQWLAQVLIYPIEKVNKGFKFEISPSTLRWNYNCCLKIALLKCVEALGCQVVERKQLLKQYIPKVRLAHLGFAVSSTHSVRFPMRKEMSRSYQLRAPCIPSGIRGVKPENGQRAPRGASNPHPLLWAYFANRRSLSFLVC